FRYPYLANTVTEFCNRWNITMFRWFYVCVFLPLGGRRAKMTRYRGAMRPRNHVVRNLALLWLGISLWYGFGLNYLLLGLWFYVFFFIEWLVTLRRKNTSSPLWILYVLLVVAVGWVFVRCGTFEQSLTYFANLTGMNRNAWCNDFTVTCLKESWHIILIAAVASTPIPRAILMWLREGRGWFGYMRTLGYLAVMAGVLYLCYIYIGVTQYATFSVR
ncbi:MAG: hypothetical protein LUC93_04675, partial [Planctomycetaceae bacterium]|nr:hypothetical protein [Planctomycetaceae bacterium]